MINRIESAVEFLSRSEKRVALFVLKNFLNIPQMTVQEIAFSTHVSKPTVVRFCQSLGYKGLSDFKKSLLKFNNSNGGVPFVHNTVHEDDRVADISMKLVNSTIVSLMNYQKTACWHSIDLAIKAICKAHSDGGRIIFFGVGNSGVVAKDARYKFLRIGLSTFLYEDGHEKLIFAYLCKSIDVVIIFSRSGCTTDMLEIANVAGSSGAQIISVTAKGSPLERISDIHLRSDDDEGGNKYLPTVSRFLHLIVVDVLAIGVAMKLGMSSIQNHMSEMHVILSKKHENSQVSSEKNFATLIQ